MKTEFKKGDRVDFTDNLRAIGIPSRYSGTRGTVKEVVKADSGEVYYYTIIADKDKQEWYATEAYLIEASKIPTEEYYYDIHYRECVVEPIKVMEENFTKEEFIGFLKGCILKYRLRMGLKDGEELTKEMAKLKRYTQWLNEVKSGKKITL